MLMCHARVPPQFVVVMAPDKRFERRGSDLFYNATITLVDALIGFSKQARRFPPSGRLRIRSFCCAEGTAQWAAPCWHCRCGNPQQQ